MMGDIGSTLRLTEGGVRAVAPEESWALRWLVAEGSARDTPITTERCSLGRAKECDLVIGDTGVSRRHAELVRTYGGFLVRDAGSANGTFVNGRRAPEQRLRAGDVLRIGTRVGMLVPSQEQVGFDEILPGLFGGAVLRAAVMTLQRGAAAALPVAIEGEPGTGRNTTAEAIHRASGRAGGFVALHGSDTQGTAGEGRLFGYRKGAFPGANRAHAGALREADRGTLFIDELSDVPIDVQVKLLRVAQDGTVQTLGAPRPQRVDARLIVATSNRLQDLFTDGRLRADLFMRLCGLPIGLPPLRDRRPDIIALARLLARRTLGREPEFEAQFAERLCLHAWPGNVRELERVVAGLAVTRPASPWRASDLPSWVGTPNRESEPSPTRGGEVPHAEPRRSMLRKSPLSDSESKEARALVAALESKSGNLAKACASVGVSRQRAYRLLGALPGFELDAVRRRR